MPQNLYDQYSQNGQRGQRNVMDQFVPETPIAPPAKPPLGGETIAGMVDGAKQYAPGDSLEKPDIFSSGNKSGRGYLEEATRWYAPKLQAIKDEGERESAVENFLRSLTPELQARGLNVGDIKKEKMQVDGKWVDLYRDITNSRGTGAAEAQWHEESGGGGPTGMPGYGSRSLVDEFMSMPSLQQNLPQYGGSDQLDPWGFSAGDQDALLQEMLRRTAGESTPARGGGGQRIAPREPQAY